MDIGMAPGSYHGVDAAAVIDRDFVLSRMPVRRGDDHKGTYGKLLTVCGCLSMSGAAVMSAASALRAGAGLVTLASTRPVIAAAASHLLEGTFLPLHEAADGGAAQDVYKRQVYGPSSCSGCASRFRSNMLCGPSAGPFA